MTLPFSLLTTALLPASAIGAPEIPEADATLKLDEYNIAMWDYPFPSGLRILFQEEHSMPVVSVSSVINHGSGSDYDGMEGMAHVGEHLAFRTQHDDLPETMDRIKQLGGGFNAFTDDDVTAYTTVAPVDALVPLLTLEAARISDGLAGVTEEHLDLEREICRIELRYANVIGDAWAGLHGLLFPDGHEYQKAGIGTHETLDAITIEALHRFFEEYYTPQYTTMVVAGDFSLDDTPAFIQQAFTGREHLLTDPKNPDAELILVEHAPRVERRELVEPPDPVGQGPVTVQGNVDKKTVVVGWTLPAGYQDDDYNYRVAADLLTSSIYQTMNLGWGPAEEQSAVGCFSQPQEQATVITCFAEPPEGWTPEKTIRVIGDSLFSAWDPDLMNYKATRRRITHSISQGIGAARGDVLRSVDPIALAGDTRDAAKLLFTHFTGNPRYYSAQWGLLNNVALPRAQEYIRDYMTRDRMAAVIVEPLDEEERARRAAAGVGGEATAYHGAQADDQYNLTFDLESLTPEVIREQMIVPDQKTIHEFTLDNGLRVAVVPYGSAPLVQVGMLLGGDSSLSDPPYLNSFAESLTSRGDWQPADDLAQVAGSYGETTAGDWKLLRADGVSGNLDFILRRVRKEVDTFGWMMAEKKRLLKDWRGTMKAAASQPEHWAWLLSAQRLAGAEHPAAFWINSDVMEAAEGWDQSMVRDWMYSKYRPDNAMLVVVGRLDPRDAEQAVRTMFGGWAPRNSTDTLPRRRTPPLGSPPERSVYVFDKEGATQSQVAFGCQLTPRAGADIAQIQVLGDVISELSWRALRERASVTYGAYAHATASADGGPALLYGAGLVQNNAIGFAVEVFLKLVADTAEGEIDERMVINARSSRAREYALGHQSSAQMMSRLAGVWASGEGFDWFDTYREALSEVTAADLPKMMEPCAGHEVVTVIGSRQHAEAQLTEAGIQYEVIDWKALYEAQLTARESRKSQGGG